MNSVIIQLANWNMWNSISCSFANITVYTSFVFYSLKSLYSSSLKTIKTCFKLIHLNIMFFEQMGRFQLELIMFLINFFTVVPFNSCVFLSSRSFVVITTFSMLKMSWKRWKAYRKTQKAKPNSLNMSLTKDMKWKQ